MIFDQENYAWDAKLLTASAASDVIRFGGTPQYIQMGEPERFLVWLDAAAKDSDGNETYKVKIETDSADTFLSPTQVGAEISIPRGSVLGSKFFLEIPTGSRVEEFVRLYATLAGTNPDLTLSAVLLPASMSEDNAAQIFFPIGYTIAS